MLLLVGLGNPGPKDLNNRHNIGFRIIDAVNSHFKLSKQKPKFKGLLTTGMIGEHKVYAIKPLTFMNNSGTAIKELIDYFKIDAKDVIVFHDDLDIDFGKIKAKFGGSSAGHHGIDSIDKFIGKDYSRVRIGIGHPKDADGNKNGEYQQRAFVKWLADNGRNMDADSTVEYIKQLITADSTWAKKYHNLGAGNRAKGRKLLRDGASVDELSDFITDKVVGPFTRGSTARQGEMAERREEASTRFARNPPGLLQEAQQYWDREGLVGGLTPRRTQQAAPPPQNLGL